MKIKNHHRDSFQQDLRLSIILISLMLLAFGLHLVRTPINILLTCLSFAAFCVFVAPYIFLGNPALIKTLRSTPQTTHRQLLLASAALWILSQLYASASGQWSATGFAISGLWLAVVLAILFFMKQKSAPHALDYLLVLLLWLPSEFGLLQSLSIPPVSGLAHPLSMIAIFILAVFYIVIRQFDIGFTYRLKANDYRIIVLNFLLFFMIAVIIGSLTGLIHVSDRLPDFSEIVIRFAVIYFLIALPEELLFRGVIYKLLIKQLQGKKWAVGKAMIFSSVLFGLAHSFSANSPYWNIFLGSIGVWHFPWAYVLLSSVAGYFYVLVFIRTQKITAAALLHLLVEWTWFVFFNG